MCLVDAQWHVGIRSFMADKREVPGKPDWAWRLMACGSCRWANYKQGLLWDWLGEGIWLSLFGPSMEMEIFRKLSGINQFLDIPFL